MLVSYQWLKEYLGEDVPSPEKVAELLTFHAFEIESVDATDDDTVIDVDVLPNRSSDCLCHRGIARELATLLARPLQNDPLASLPSLATTDAIEVEIEDPLLCPRFTVSLVRGITVKESPQWLQTRLRAIGQRPINNIVDATNYVMFALGQPIHAYDADLFPAENGVWKFGVRAATAGEEVSLIAEGSKNGNKKDEERTVALAGGELLIIDRTTGTPAGLAGVKGGRFAGVHAGTKNVLIEAAHFDPARTRKTARGLGIVIDASKRFENEPSRELPPYAQKEVTDLIMQIAGGACEGFIDAYLEQKSVPSVLVRPERVNALLGLSLSTDEMQHILTRVGCTLIDAEGNFTVTGPWERTDLQIEEDFIEEIGRVYGYDHVVSVVPPSVPLTEYNARQYYSERVRTLLVDLGFSEVITSSFRKKDTISLFNALASDKGCLRSTLVKSIEEVLDRNTGFRDFLGAQDTRVFEIGTVFTKSDGSISEHVSLCLGVRSKPSGYSKKDDEVLAEVTDALTKALGSNTLFVSGNGIAELNFSELVASLPQPAAYEPVEYVRDVQYKPYSLYPSVSRDIALFVDAGTTAQAVAGVLDASAGPLRRRTTLFDEFSKEGRTSYAFRLVFQSDEKTLTDEEVNGFMEAVYAAVAKQGWEVR